MPGVGNSGGGITALQAAALTRPPYVAGRYYWPYPTATSSVAVATNTVRLTPFTLSQAVTLSELVASIIGVSAGGNIQLAIYGADATTGLPAGAALAVTGNMTTASAVALSGAITGGAVSFAAGFSGWAAINADNSTATLLAVAPTAIYLDAMVGVATVTSLGSSNPRLVYSVASTFGTWPNLTSSPPSIAGNTEHIVGFKVSAVP